MNSIVQFFKDLQENDALTPCWMVKVKNDFYKDILFYIVKEMLYTKAFQNHGMSNSFVAKQVDQQAYPNFLYVTRPLLEDGTLANEIKIEDAKKVKTFLQKKPAIEGWRVVLIDTIDDMNHFAANSLLKLIEEPPKKTLILLSVKQVGLILPTIRSRCKILPLESTEEENSPTTFQDLEEIIRTFIHNKTQNLDIFFRGVIEKNKDLSIFKKELLKIVYKKNISLTHNNRDDHYQLEHWVNVFEALNIFFNATDHAHLDSMHVLNMSFSAIKNPHIILKNTIHDL